METLEAGFVPPDGVRALAAQSKSARPMARGIHSFERRGFIVSILIMKELQKKR
jgi:hypothetical protein